MPPVKNVTWQKLPALRLLLPFITGIIIQWYLIPPFALVICIMIFSFVAFFIVQLSTLQSRFSLKYITGFTFNIFFIATGCLALWCKNIRHDENWIGKVYKRGDLVIVSIDEPPVEKTNVYRVTAKAEISSRDGKYFPLAGKIIVSFPKTIKPPAYGSRLVISKHLNEIKNSGNPASFDYKTYCLFQGITHDVYLAKSDFIFLNEKNGNLFFEKLFLFRSYIVSVFKKYVSGVKDQGLAEALLIGYKDDLDKDLVKAYANTGIVHIIAISGLHLALVYGLLMLLTTPLRNKKLIWARFVIVVSGLWIFSLLAGAQPSILRASVMFTAIAFKMLINRRGSVFNSISLAALVLLCYNPFWLWDAGFQLSFLAVASILMFYRPVYNWIYLENKAVDFIWQLAAASISAQILTIPITLFYFHQFPYLFLFTNIVAVPLSGIVIYVEILLCVFSFFSPVATVTAKILSWLIGFMNTYVDRFNDLPFGLWNGISISFLQALLLYGIILGFCYWLISKTKAPIYLALTCTVTFLCIRSVSFIHADSRQAIVIYNIPRHKAIDIIAGRNCFFIGDSLLGEMNGNTNPEIQTCRTTGRITQISFSDKNVFDYCKRRIVLIDSSSEIKPVRGIVDYLIISGNTKLRMDDFAQSTIRNVIIDASVPAWKSPALMKDCQRLNIPCYNVAEKGAFLIDL
jgi:competence protein ComEC